MWSLSRRLFAVRYFSSLTIAKRTASFAVKTESSQGPALLRQIKFSYNFERGKKKKKKKSDLDAQHSRLDKDIREKALQELFTANILDKSNLNKPTFDELFDQSLPVYKTLIIRLISLDLQRLEAFDTFMRKNLTYLQFQVSCLVLVLHLLRLFCSEHPTLIRLETSPTLDT